MLLSLIKVNEESKDTRVKVLSFSCYALLSQSASLRAQKLLFFPFAESLTLDDSSLSLCTHLADNLICASLVSLPTCYYCSLCFHSLEFR